MSRTQIGFAVAWARLGIGCRIKTALPTVRCLCIFVTLIACGCRDSREAETQKQLISTIETLNGQVVMERGQVVGIILYNTEVSDSDLRQLNDSRSLRYLNLAFCGRLTDNGLRHLAGLPNLQTLWLGGTKVTDTGLDHLKELKSLRRLGLSYTSVTDAGLVHLSDLTELEMLDLGGNRISAKGLIQLHHLTNLRELDLSHTSITDEDVRHLRKLGTLRALSLQGTRITDVGIMHLEGMHNLEKVNLTCSDVTDAGIRDLQELLPNARIVK